MKSSVFNCKIYDKSFKNVYNSYLGKNDYYEIVYKGGGASGKSENIANNIVFWLPEHHGDEAVVIVYSAGHKNNTFTRFQRILTREKFTYDYKKSDDGNIIINYGNSNKITIISVKTSSIEETVEKMKTFTTSNSRSIKFFWYEEFTAILNEFKQISRYEFATSRLNREKAKNAITFYSFNPPPHFGHIVFEWLNMFDGLTIHSTIYDLPKKWQSEEDLKKAEKMRKNNLMQFRSVYLGEAVGQDGLAYNTSDTLTEDVQNYTDFQIFTDNGVKDATSFLLFGFHGRGVHVLDTFYYSGRENTPKTSAEFVHDLEKFIEMHGLNRSVQIVTDDLDFGYQLQNKGLNAKYISSITPKKRSLYYKQTKYLIDSNRLKILNTPNNLITFQQLTNAEVEDKQINGIYQTVVKKVDNSTTSEHRQLHAIDPIHYFSLVNYKKLGGTE